MRIPRPSDGRGHDVDFAMTLYLALSRVAGKWSPGVLSTRGPRFHRKGERQLPVLLLRIRSTGNHEGTYQNDSLLSVGSRLKIHHTLSAATSFDPDPLAFKAIEQATLSTDSPSGFRLDIQA